jgi:hypothetical protein
METVFETPTYELVKAMEQIKQLEEKINRLEHEVKEKDNTISAIEKNMERLYVENWTVKDKDGKEGTFSGNVYWIKGGGIVFYKNSTIFEGDWDSTGEITDGELRETYGDYVIAKWEAGEEIELDDEDDDDEESDYESECSEEEKQEQSVCDMPIESK